MEKKENEKKQKKYKGRIKRIKKKITTEGKIKEWNVDDRMKRKRNEWQRSVNGENMRIRNFRGV